VPESDAPISLAPVAMRLSPSTCPRLPPGLRNAAVRIEPCLVGLPTPRAGDAVPELAEHDDRNRRARLGAKERADALIAAQEGRQRIRVRDLTPDPRAR
jgi:hypothetical protein